MFKPLGKSEIRKIVDIQFDLIKERLSQAEIELSATDVALDYLGELGFDPQLGQDHLKGNAEIYIERLVVKEILSCNVENNGRITRLGLR